MLSVGGAGDVDLREQLDASAAVPRQQPARRWCAEPLCRACCWVVRRRPSPRCESHLLRHFIVTTIILPRQARDNHRKKHSKERDAFFAGTKDCVRFDMGWLYNGKMKSGGKCLTNKGGRLSLETCCISHCGADRCENGAWFSAS